MFQLPGRALLSLLFVALCSVLLAAPAFEQANSNPPPIPKNAKAHPPVDQEQFVCYWTTETGWRSELQLRNNLAAQDLVVTPIVRTPDGTETALSPVTINPQAVVAADIQKALMNSAPQLIGTYGSLVLRYHSPSFANLYAVLMVHSTGHPFAFHIDGIGMTESYQAGSREGVWWLPRDTTNDYLVLTNQGRNPINAVLSLYDSSGKESRQQITLGPGALTRLSVRTLIAASGLAGTFGGIKVSAPAHAGAFDTLHVLFDEDAAFSAVLKMFDQRPGATIRERDFARTKVWTLRAPMLALSNPDPALHFPQGTVLQPQLFIRNTTPRQVGVAVRFSWKSDTASGRAAGPTLQLNPFETRRVDVADLQNQGVLPADAHWTSVILATDSLPDEVMAVAASYDPTLNYGAQTPFSDQLAAHWVGSMWEFDSEHDSIITVGNGGTKPARALFTIHYNQGTEKYEVERTLQPDEQMWFDIGQLIRQGLADKNRKVLPADLTSGNYEVRDITNTGSGTLFAGKVIYDNTFGHVSYGCEFCCGYDTGVLFWYDPLQLWKGETANQTIQTYNYCDGLYEDVTLEFDFGWYTVNTNIATVDDFGKHTGVSAGSTTTVANGQLYAQDTRNGCPLEDSTGEGNTTVDSAAILMGSQNTDVTSTTQSVVIGQQIALTASYSLTSGVSVSSQSWSVPGTIVGGYTASSSSASTTSATLNQATTTFYWVIPGNSQQVTLTVHLSNGIQRTAQATFNVVAPSPGSPTVSLPASGLLYVNTLSGCSGVSGGPFLDFGNLSGGAPGCGNPGGTPGIVFTPPSAQSPPGTFFFAQLINSDSVVYTPPSGSNLTCTGVAGDDGQFPYQGNTGQAVNDAPEAQLADPNYTTTSRSFTATMYLFWQSNTQNSIPVALGSVTWQFSGSTTFSNGAWATPSGGGSAGNFTAATGTNDSVPTWGNLAVLANLNCH